MKKLMLAAFVGAAAMWFGDPVNGAQRRDALQRMLNGRQTPIAVPTPFVAPDEARSDSPVYAAR